MALITPLALKFAHPTFPELDIAGAIYTISIDSSDNNYIFGSFNKVQGNTRYSMAKISDSNVLDGNFGTNNLGTPTFYTAASAYDFSTSQEIFFVILNTLAKIKKSDSTLVAQGTQAFSGPVYGILPDNNIVSPGVFVRGTFSKVGTTSRNTIAKFNQTPTLVTTWSCNPPAGYMIQQMRLSKTSADHMFVSGNFRTIKGSTRGSIARVRRDTGAVDTSFNAKLSNGYINHFDVNADGTLIVAGQYYTQFFLNKLSSTGALLSTFTTTIMTMFNDIGMYSDFFAIDIQPLYLDITSAGDILIAVIASTHRGTAITPITFLARLTSAGAFDTTFNTSGYMQIENTNIGQLPIIKSIGINSADRLVISGTFTTINGISRDNYAVLEDDGSVVTFA